MEEIWKDIKGYEGLYQVSNKGRVKSLERVKQNHSKLQVVHERIIKTHNNGKDLHQALHLSKEGVNYKEYLHRLVAFAFPEMCGKYFEGAVVNHKDENPLNNNAENLEWVTIGYNNGYGTKRIRHSKVMSKKPVLQIKNNIIICEYPSAEKAGNVLGIHSNAIINCCKHKYGFKTCGGYKWEFK